MTATVIIPVTGVPECEQAIDSVLNQTYPTTCYVVCDGDQFKGKVSTIVSERLGNQNLKVCYLPINVGANGFYGHRAYAAFTHLVNTKYVMYLDQDNWLDPNHVQSCINTIEKNELDWCYSLRKIYTKNGDFVCEDNCESLGRWQTYHGMHHVDTNTYCLKTEIATKIASSWHGGWGQDRVFLQTITQYFQKWNTTGEYTLNYRVDGQQGSVNSDFFINGNKVMNDRYNGEFPWETQTQLDYYPRVLLVGESSFIAKNVDDIFLFDKCDYKNFKSYNLKDYDVVLNCALNPLYKIQKYQEKIDVDFEIGKQVCENNVHYVMLSTSKVYGQYNDLKTFTEESPAEPFDFYGENKYITENKLLTNFGDKVTILRGSNIFGYEYGRNSFMGYCMSQLVNEGKITLTMNENVKRDFLFVVDAGYLIREVCIQRPSGIYNLSSGCGFEVGRIIRNLIDGYKYGGEIEIKSDKFERQFILDNSKLKNALDVEIGPFFFDVICYNLGQQLCKTW